jgi:membrane associated rhomboid family serine protease
MKKSLTGIIIILNAIVFFMWMIIDTQFMINNFLVSTDSLLEGRVWTLITSVFSHNLPFHLLINMLVFYSFGRVLENILGAKRLLSLFLIAGIAGSFSHCLTSTLMLNNSSLPALGASGAVSGILVVFSFMFPKQLIYVFGFIPIPAMVGTIIFVGIDLVGLFTQAAGSSVPIGHGAHLGGALAGFIYFCFLKLPKRFSS